MGIAERRERERQQRIDLILDAAEEVLLEKGFRNATMEEIAERAELSKATLYIYFKTKELIHAGIKLRGTVVLARYFTEAIEGRGTGWDKVGAIGEAYFRFAQEQPVYFQVMSHFEEIDPAVLEQNCDDPLVQALDKSGTHVLEILADVITEGIADRTMRADLHPMKTAIYMWAAGNGIFQMHMGQARVIAQYAGFGKNFLLEEHERHLRAALANPGT